MTDGKKSSFQLTRIAAKYNEIQQNGQVLSNRHAMDIIWVRIEQLLDRIQENYRPERIEALFKLWTQHKEQTEAGQYVESRVTAREIDDEFEKEYHDYKSWQQLVDMLAIHSKMTESEVKIMKDLRMIMTAEDAYQLVAQVMAVMLRVLKDDPKRLKEAQFELTRLIGEGKSLSVPGLEEGSDELTRFPGETSGRVGRSGGESRSDSGSGDLDREELLHTGNEERSYIEGSATTGGVSEGPPAGDIQEG
jgi:hypothetical protein